jgi:predicted enzyme related to lactoylglutathione lyase
MTPNEDSNERSGALEVLGVDNVLVAVGDFELALDFYAGRLGLPLKFQLPNLGIACFRLGAEEPGLIVRAGDVHARGARDTPRLWLEVRDARAAAVELGERGMTTLGEPFEVATGWTVEVADPWGNVLGLTDYTKDPVRARTG